MNFESQNTLGTTYVSGIINTDTTWNLAGSPYIVVGDVTVANGATLTIEPSVEVRFDDLYYLYLDGNLSAIGIATNKIAFTSNKIPPNLNDWGGIKINPEGCVKLDNCIVKYAENGIHANESQKVEIRNCTISNNGKNGVYIIGSPYSNIVNCNISDNGNGIEIDTSPNCHIVNSIISKNGGYQPSDGIDIFRSSNVKILKSTITLNNQDGLKVKYDSHNVTVEDCNIIANGDEGVETLYAPFLTFLNTSIFQNGDDGLEIGDSPNLTVINCNISKNNCGLYLWLNTKNCNVINTSISNSGTSDFGLQWKSNVTTLNTSFNKKKVSFRDDIISNITIKWYLHVKVVDLNGNPISSANVKIKNTTDSIVYNGITDPNGYAKWIICTEYYQKDNNGDHDGRDPGEKLFFTPHNITVTKSGITGYALPEPNMNKSKEIVITLDSSPSVLPHTNLTTRVVNNGNNVELEWDPPSSIILDHYLIYRADSATEFDFSTPYNSSTTWPNPKNTTWIDSDTNITAVDDDFYYIVRAANFDESIVSLTSNTAGVWTRTFHDGISTFSLPLEPFVKKDTEFYCQDMNASYIKWMNLTTHTWMRHDRGSSENNSIIEIGKGYEIGFLSKSIQTKHTFTGMPGAMILYDNISLGFDATPLTGNADSLTATVDSGDNITLNWTQPANMGSEDRYYVLRSTSRDGFWGTESVNYTQLVVLPFDVLSYQDICNATAGIEYYYMIVPVNLSTGERGVSSYSIGVWIAGYLDQYDTFALPLRVNNNRTVDWYCDNIPDTVGINYYIYSEQRWCWHSTRMPAGAYDPILVMAEGYQVSTSNSTKFTFIGR